MMACGHVLELGNGSWLSIASSFSVRRSEPVTVCNPHLLDDPLNVLV